MRLNLDKHQNLCISKFLDPIQNGVLFATVLSSISQGCVYLAVLQICPFLSETNFRFMPGIKFG